MNPRLPCCSAAFVVLTAVLTSCGGRGSPDGSESLDGSSTRSADREPTAAGSAATEAPPPPPLAVPIPDPAPAPTPVPTTASPSVPVWWLGEPVEEGGFVSVCASAEHESMIAARTAALAAARKSLAARTNQAPMDEATKIDAAPLPGGGFRAFVRLTARR